jgi:hypothetical protein
MRHQISWSALTCSMPGAGVYCGIAPFTEHVELSKGMPFRKLRVFADGIIVVRDSGQQWPLNYIALRDPSAVKVIPIQQPPVDDFRHARLLFTVSPVPEPQSSFDISGIRAQASANRDPNTPFAFVLSVGLPPDREEDLFLRTFADHPQQDWEQIYGRLREMGCGAGGRKTNGEGRPRTRD